MSHPKLIEALVQQTPRTMVAMLIVSSVYFWMYFQFIPFTILAVWFSLQILLALYRLHNAKMFEKYVHENDQAQIEKQKLLFLLSAIFQALMWTVSSILVSVYAPQPYELTSFIMIIGVITAAVITMSTIYHVYLVFFSLMITPQIIIMLYYGEHQHVGLVIFTLIYIPSTILLSRALYENRLSSILDNCELEKSVNELHKLSMIDNLTNIYNRRYFFKMSQDLVSIAAREQKKVSLLMIDIDYFKKINDTYGHQAGDFILVSLVKEIEKVMRKSDIFARIGGEEFSILLHNTSIEGACVIAEKIREIIENKVFTYNSISINLTISIGIAELNEKHTSIETLYTQADKQLYFAKASGRNKVAA